MLEVLRAFGTDMNLHFRKIIAGGLEVRKTRDHSDSLGRVSHYTVVVYHWYTTSSSHVVVGGNKLFGVWCHAHAHALLVPPEDTHFPPLINHTIRHVPQYIPIPVGQ